MFTTTLYLLLVLSAFNKLYPDRITSENASVSKIDSITAALSSKSNRRQNLLKLNCDSKTNVNNTLFATILLLSGDIQLNPGPRTTSTYPCGYCEDPVTWDCRGIACDNCSIWYHGSCMELCTKDFSLLEKSNVQWLCHKCDSINCDTFTFRSFSLNCSNFYTPISDPNLTLESINSVFSPLKASSPT